MQPTEDNQDQPLSDYVFFLAANSSNPEKLGEAQVQSNPLLMVHRILVHSTYWFKARPEHDEGISSIH